MLTKEEWDELYLEKIDEVISEINIDYYLSTPADTGLLMDIFAEYFENKNEYWVYESLMVVKKILEAKNKYNDLSWFDMHNTIIMPQSRYDVEKLNINKTKESEYDSNKPIHMQINNNNNDTHIGHFTKKCKQLSKTLEQNETELTQEIKNPIYKNTNEKLNHILKMSNGFQYGAIEIPNNLSRMRLVDIINYIQTLKFTEEEYKTLFHLLNKWLELYARAESAYANEKLTHEELIKYIADEETPADKYWG